MRTNFKVQNIKCNGCVNSIECRLKKIEGVSKLSVDPDQGSISFEYANETAKMQVQKALDNMGYVLHQEDNTLSKKAASYVNCIIGRISKV